MAYKQLAGNELFYVEGVQTNGQPAPITFKTTTGLVAGAPMPPVAGGAASTLTFLNAGNINLLNVAAGTTFTLPAATGSGVSYKFVVSTTASSNAHKILAASSADFITGRATGATAAGATLQFSANPAATHSIQMPFAGTQPSGGFSGDWFTFTDIAANLWEVQGQYQAGTTATTPFSTATT